MTDTRTDIGSGAGTGSGLDDSRTHRVESRRLSAAARSEVQTKLTQVENQLRACGCSCYAQPLLRVFVSHPSIPHADILAKTVGAHDAKASRQVQRALAQYVKERHKDLSAWAAGLTAHHREVLRDADRIHWPDVLSREGLQERASSVREGLRADGALATEAQLEEAKKMEEPAFLAMEPAAAMGFVAGESELETEDGDDEPEGDSEEGAAPVDYAALVRDWNAVASESLKVDRYDKAQVLASF